MQGMMQGLVQGLNQPAQPKTEEQIEEERQAAERAKAERAAIKAEMARKKQEHLASLDRKAFAQLSLLDSSFNPQKTASTSFRTPVPCNATNTSLHVCRVLVCGGGRQGPGVCCPAGFPKLNECDCNCYPSDANFACMRYADCNYSLDTNSPEPPKEESSAP